MKRSKFLIGLLGMLLAIGIFNSRVYAASGEDDPQKGTSMSNEEKDEGGIALYSLDADPYTGLVYTHNHPNADNGITYGIDVSYYNGTIDWNAVKNAGIQNVMIRVGYRGYGSSGSLNEDVNYKQNIEGALDAGLNVGVYFFSQAVNQQEASDEADYVIERIRDYDITLPVVIDFEYADTGSGLGGRLYNADLSVDKATRVCKAFCRIVEEEGYTAMVYANKSMLENNLDAAELSDKYKVWLANYTTNTSYNGYYDVWQYSSRGHVNGINGYVDCNFWYEESDTVYNGVDYAAVYNYDYYIAANEDVREAFHGDKSRTLEHFVTSGMAEGRQGSAEFNVNTYKNRYSDLRSAFGNDLKQYYLHYITCGKAEGRDGSGTSEVTGALTVYEGIDYSSVYDFSYYSSNNEDVKAVNGDDDYATLQHFVLNGMPEGRQGNSEFNVYAYRNRYDDLRNAFGDDLKSYYMHYITCGKQEGRTGEDTSRADAVQNIYEGVDYSAVYNKEFYLENYNDVRTALGDDDFLVLQHFVTAGMKEGRQGNEEFNVDAYRSRYGDLNAAFGDDLASYYVHYITCGKAEGRDGSASEVHAQTEEVMPVEPLLIEESVSLDNEEIKEDVIVIPEEEQAENISEETEQIEEPNVIEETGQHEESNAIEETEQVNGTDETGETADEQSSSVENDDEVLGEDIVDIEEEQEDAEIESDDYVDNEESEGTGDEPVPSGVNDIIDVYGENT